MKFVKDSPVFILKNFIHYSCACANIKFDLAPKRGKVVNFILVKPKAL